MINTSLSFFDPVAVFDSPQSKRRLALGEFGEWLFNFKRAVYHIRKDGLESKVGTEVVRSECKESWKSNVLRVALCILVIPAVVALFDRIAHRIQHSNIHENLLPSHFRNQKKVVILQDKIHMNRSAVHNHIESVLHSKCNIGDDSSKYPIVLVFVQPKPWLVPEMPLRAIRFSQASDGTFQRIDDPKADQIKDERHLEELLSRKAHDEGAERFRNNTNLHDPLICHAECCYQIYRS